MGDASRILAVEIADEGSEGNMGTLRYEPVDDELIFVQLFAVEENIVEDVAPVELAA